jgi:hypothetical protein
MPPSRRRAGGPPPGLQPTVPADHGNGNPRTPMCRAGAGRGRNRTGAGPGTRVSRLVSVRRGEKTRLRAPARPLRSGKGMTILGHHRSAAGPRSRPPGAGRRAVDPRASACRQPLERQRMGRRPQSRKRSAAAGAGVPPRDRRTPGPRVRGPGDERSAGGAGGRGHPRARAGLRCRPGGDGDARPRAAVTLLAGQRGRSAHPVRCADPRPPRRRRRRRGWSATCWPSRSTACSSATARACWSASSAPWTCSSICARRSVQPGGPSGGSGGRGSCGFCVRCAAWEGPRRPKAPR